MENNSGNGDVKSVTDGVGKNTVRKWSRRSLITLAAAALPAPIFYACFRRASLREAIFTIDGPFLTDADFEGKSWIERFEAECTARNLNLTFPELVTVWSATFETAGGKFTMCLLFTFDDAVAHGQLKLDISLLDRSGHVITSKSRFHRSAKVAADDDFGYVPYARSMQNSSLTTFKIGNMIKDVMAVEVTFSEVAQLPA